MLILFHCFIQTESARYYFYFGILYLLRFSFILHYTYGVYFKQFFYLVILLLLFHLSRFAEPNCLYSVQTDIGIK